MQKIKAVTLVELLVAMAILVLLVLILYSVFNISLRGWNKSDNMLQAAEIARIVLERMTREIASAIIKSGSNQFYCVGYNRSSPSGFRTNSSNLGDEFYFIAALNPGDDNQSDLCEAGYWLNSRGTIGTEDDSLMRFYVTDDRKIDASPDFDFDFSSGGSDELSINITELKFLYYDQSGTEYTTWDSRNSGKPPAKIKIVLTIEVGKGLPATNPDYFKDNFSAIVYLPQ